MAVSNELAAVPSSRGRIAGAIEKPIRSLMARIAVGKNVRYGRNLRAGLGVLITSPHGLSIGNSVSVGQRSTIEVDGTIGDFCLIARGVQILGRSDHAIDELGVPMALSTWVGTRESRPTDRVDIGKDVWLGAGVIVLGGVTIGDGAVIGAGSVVTTDIEPFAIAVGSPARKIRLRFNTAQERESHLKQIEGP
jgi:acetyltransferase-like isoleucine patch superfamily enzyme